MLNFVKMAFRGFLGVLLWINLLGCAVAGSIIGAAGRDGDDAAVGVIIGFAVGGLVGILMNVLWGGIIATLLAIEDNTAKTARNTGKMFSILEKRSDN
jgi:hypothetical protein